MGRTNPFIDNFFVEEHQRLLEDLIVGAIEFGGHNVYYIPRNLVNFDQLYLTDDQSSYTQAIPTVVFIENIDGFEGQRDIFTTFGLEIRDQISLTMSTRHFNEDIMPVTGKTRPDEGDLIYFTMNKKCFQIKFTNNKEFFYPLGSLPSYLLTCQLMEYSNELINTGIPEIDILQKKFSTDVLDNVITNEQGSIVTSEDGDRLTVEMFDLDNILPTSDNEDLTKQANTFIDNNTSANPIGRISLNFGDQA